MEIEINSKNMYNFLILLSKILDKRTCIYKEVDRILKEYKEEDIVKLCNNILTNS